MPKHSLNENASSKLFHNPAMVIVSSFFILILVGTFLLMLPICSRSGEVTPFLNSLFTATSATCVTGLVVYDTYTYFSIFGQCVIITLIQLGGLGLVTLTSFITPISVMISVTQWEAVRGSLHFFRILALPLAV